MTGNEPPRRCRSGHDPAPARRPLPTYAGWPARTTCAPVSSTATSATASPAAPSGSTGSPPSPTGTPADLAKALAEHRTNHLPGDATPHRPAETIRQRQARTALFAAIRHDAANNPALSTRFLAERHGVHRRTVQTALTAAAPPPRKPPPKRGSRLDQHQAVIEAMLPAPRPRRVTIQEVHDHLTKVLGLDVSYSTVRTYIRTRRARPS
jgi:hypothetical protein